MLGVAPLSCKQAQKPGTKGSNGTRSYACAEYIKLRITSDLLYESKIISNLINNMTQVVSKCNFATCVEIKIRVTKS